MADMDRAGIPLTDMEKTLDHERSTTTDIYLDSIREAQPMTADIIEEQLRNYYQKSLTHSGKSLCSEADSPNP